MPCSTLRGTIRLVALASVVVMGAGAARAEYPEQPIKVIVPFGPGGVTDTTARIFQKTIADHDLLSQPVTIINVPGAGGTVGSRQALGEPADGYNFLISHLALMSAEAAGQIEFGYKDFEPIAGTTDFCHVAVVPVDSPYQTLAEMLDDAKARPGEMVFAANLGANIHMMGIMLEDAMPGAKFRFAQIGGEAQVVTSLKGNVTEVSTISVGGFKKFESEGLRALATLAPERDPALPDLPTAREQGFDVSFCVQSWWFAPKGTPAEAIDSFNDALEAALETDDAKEAFTAISSQITYVDGEELAARMVADYETIAPIAARAKP